MKKFFFSFLVALTTLTANAQKTDKQMATLQHGNQTMVFYGIDAFKQAYDAAADTLDVITLSSGEFNAPSIQKSITVYGAGFEDDETTGTNRTFINSSISIYPADAEDEDGNIIKGGKHVNGVHLEGLYIQSDIFCYNNNNVPISNLSIVKCYLSSLVFYIPCSDCTIRQSVVDYAIYNNGNENEQRKATNMLISNCWIGSRIAWFDNSSTIKIDHCICCPTYYSTYYGSYEYTNNIMFSTPEYGAIVRNNVFIGCDYTSDISEGNWGNLATAGVFAAEGEDGSYAAEKDFALKYPKKHVGNDGTEIGLHGGTYAWNKIPLIPRITSYELDTSNAANGTIKVSIKAEAQTKE